MKVLITICARAGSKGLAGKNIRPLANKPLIAHTIEYAKAQKADCILSTNSSDIAFVAEKYGLECLFLRDAVLASDKAGKIPVIKDALLRAQKHYSCEYDYVVDLDVTAPIRQKADFANALKMAVEGGFDTVLSATKARKNPYFNIVETSSEGTYCAKKGGFLCRQDAPKCFDLNASIYVFRAAALLEENYSVYGRKTGVYEMAMQCAYDIDNEFDFALVEWLLGKG